MDVVAAFRAARNDHAYAVNVFNSPSLASFFREIIVLSAEYRLPAMYQWKEHVEAGGLVSFGPSLAAMYRQTGTIVVKILKGAKPSELPDPSVNISASCASHSRRMRVTLSRISSFRAL